MISAGFGFSDLIARHGIERRVHTAGTAKSWLDPFRPERPEDVARLHRLLEPIHEAFKAQVRARRGDRLDPARDYFTGDVWVGREAVSLGLADGIGHLEPVMRDLFGDKVRFQTYGQRVLKPTPAFMTYSLAKAGLWWLTRTSAQALAPHVRVNAIGPGPTMQGARQSDAHFARQRAATILQRGADAGDIARALLYLLDAKAVTGQLICVDGGQHLGWQTPDILGS